MKALYPCIKCNEEDALRHITHAVEAKFYPCDISEDGVAEVNCEVGHKILYVSMQPKYELLLTFGSLAYIDGYYREAVATYASALERFLEFFVLSTIAHLQVAPDMAETAWKAVAKQSERQLGAFIFMHLTKYGEVKIPLNQERTTFRNAAVHQGKIISKGEAHGFCEHVFVTIRDLLTRMQADMMDSMQKVNFSAKKASLDSVCKGNIDSASSYPVGILKFNDLTPGTKTFDAEIQTLARLKTRFFMPPN